MSQPKAWPHAGLTPEGEAIPDMADPSCGTEEAPFQAVLVFSDPIDWYRDLQLITDVIMSGQHDMSCCVYASSSLTPSCQVLLHVWQLIADVIIRSPPGYVFLPVTATDSDTLTLIRSHSVLWLLGETLAPGPAGWSAAAVMFYHSHSSSLYKSLTIYY